MHSGFEMNSKMVLLSVGVVLLLVGALAGYLYGVNSVSTKTTTSTTTVSASLDAYERVANSFANHMLFLSSRNASAIVSQYEQNANVTWFGKPLAGFGFAGFYNGTGNIFLLMNTAFIGHGGSFTLGNVTHNVVNISDDSAVVNSSFAFFGQNSYFGTGFIGNANGTVSAQDSYVYSAANGVWLISEEVWNFTSFNASPGSPP